MLPDDVAAERTRETRAHKGHTWCLRCVRPARSTPLQDRNADRFEKPGRHDVELRGEVARLRADEPNRRPASVVAIGVAECAGVADGSHAGQCGDPLQEYRVIVQAVVERAIAVRAGKRTQPRAEDLGSVEARMVVKQEVERARQQSGGHQQRD